MGIKLLPDGRTEVIHYYRKPDGTASHLKRTINSQRQKDVIQAKAELIEQAEKCSLKNQCCRWEELVDAVLRKNNGAGMPWVYNQVREGLKGYVDENFVKRYNRYIDKLEQDERSCNTISNHKSVIRRVLNFAYQSGRIDNIPIRKFDIEQKFRERVWNSTEERTRFFNTLEKYKSHLFWAITLLERRPIRAESDLYKLTDENLVRNNGLPYLRYLAKKTENKAKWKETHIPLYTFDGKVFEDLIEYFDHGRPQGCRLLFPRLRGKIESVRDFDGMRNAEWFPMGDPKRHWNYICDNAEPPISNFHVHDLKHIATGTMIEEGWSIERMLAMGIQFSDKMIKEVYWKRNAEKALLPEQQKAEEETTEKVVEFR